MHKNYQLELFDLIRENVLRLMGANKEIRNKEIWSKLDSALIYLDQARWFKEASIDNSRVIYKKVKDGEAVFINNRRLGIIKAVRGGWAYFPKGSKTSGQTFNNPLKVKETLEHE